MSTDNIPTSTLRELLEQAKALEEHSFTMERTITIRVTGNVIPDAWGSSAIIDELNVSVLGSGDLQAYIEEAIQEAVLDDPTAFQEIEAGLATIGDGLEDLRIDVNNVEAEYDLDEGTLGGDLEEKVGFSIF